MTQTQPGWVEYRGRTLYDTYGSKIGRIVEIYLEQQGGQAEWALVQTGLLGTKQTFVPLRGAQAEGDDLRATVGKDQAQQAPHIEPGSELSEQDEQRLFQHYDVSYTTEGFTTAAMGTRTRDRRRRAPAFSRSRAGAAPTRTPSAGAPVITTSRVGAPPVTKPPGRPPMRR